MRKGLFVFVLVITFIIGNIGLRPSVAEAHAYLASADPKPESELTTAPSVMHLTFTEDIDTKLSSVQVLDESGNVMPSELSAMDNRTLMVSGLKLSNGMYTVKWQTLSVDTHVTEDSYRFAVGVSLTKKGPTGSISLDDPSDSSGNQQGGVSNSGNVPSKDKDTATKGDGGKTSGKDAGSKPSGSKPVTPPKNSPSPEASGTENKKEDISSNPAAKESQKKPDQPSDHAAPSNQNEGTEAAQKTDPPAKEDENKTENVVDNRTVVKQESLTNQEQSAASTQQESDSGHDHHTAGSIGDQSTSSSDEAPIVSDSSLEASTSAHQHEASLSDSSHEAPLTFSLSNLYRILEVIAYVFIGGTLFFIDWLSPGRSMQASRIQQWLYAAAGLLIISGFARLSQLSSELGQGDWGSAFMHLAGSMMLGWMSLLRMAMGILIILLLMPRFMGEIWRYVRLLLLLILSITFPLTGHAYQPGSGLSFSVWMHVIHMVVTVGWCGGLAGLLVMSWKGSSNQNSRDAFARHWSELLRKFAVFAIVLMGAAALSGVGLTLNKVKQVNDLVQYGYGNLVVVKIILFVLVILLAAYHRYYLMPQLKHAAGQGEMTTNSNVSVQRKLLFGIRLELIAALLLFIAAGWLASSMPPM
ncbi:copper resistance protein CopC [Paenibacillus sp. 1001270B_150601_E10]|uniref:copper resistance protein CopC n=1 Tax=Paenibacillus sp. 1001270B_150601_E10 TaxID=2787079 RepID=UPI00189ED39F|nr:copper resistance protein CopC [Paenibacillus sp. 1001270B_150601_E10]